MRTFRLSETAWRLTFLARRFPDGRFGATGSRTSVPLLAGSNAFGGLVVLDTGPRGLKVFSATQTNKHMSIPFVRQAPPEAVAFRERGSEVLRTFAGYEGLRAGRASHQHALR